MIEEKSIEHHGENHKKHDETHHAKNKKSDTLTINKVTVWRAVSAILAILLIWSLFTGGFRGFKTEVQDTQPTQAVQPAQPRDDSQQGGSDSGTDMTELIDDDEVKGDPGAPVTIVEWSDFECPYCTRFYEQTLWQIEKEYIDTGKVKFVYRDFPLGFHKNAQKAAEATECAGEQGKFWEMHDKLFEEGVSGGVSSFKRFAADIGLDTDEFNECLDSGKMANEVKEDMADGAAVGIRGTPGFIINGQLVSGAQPFENFKQIIEAELAK